MKKMRKMAVSVAVGALIFFVINVYAASGTCKVYYNSSLAVGESYSINTLLSYIGYSSSVSADPSTTTLNNTIKSSNKIMFIHTHGGPGCLECAGASYLYVTSMTSSGLSMAYLSACKSAAWSTTYGTSTAYKLNTLGVPRVVGFTNNIYASSQTNGIHRFNLEFFSFLTNGYSLANSAIYAKQALYNAEGSYSGADSVVVYGGSLTTP